MEKQFIPYDLAVKLKELGFNKECFATYIGTHFKSKCYGSIKDYENKELFTPAPLWQQAFQFIQSKIDLYEQGLELTLTPKEWLLIDDVHYWSNEKALEKLIKLVEDEK